MEKRDLSTKILFWIATFFAFAVLGAGLYYRHRHPEHWEMVAAGSICVVLVAITQTLARAIKSNHLGTPEKLLHPLIDRLDQLSILLNLMSEQQLLSDRAIAIAYREKDREALQRAVHEEMGRHEWDAALSLVDEMEKAFGLKSEAQRLRKEIDDRRNELVRKQINEVVQVIDKHTRTEQWNAAVREADRLLQMFPDNDQVKNLPHEIDNRRQAHKKQLMSSWYEAVARHDTDGSIEILKQLDPYLTRIEAAAMEEQVRSVFKEKLTNLGGQFKAAYQEQRYSDAIRVGEIIIREFPNSGIAQEVREKMEPLKRKVEPAAV